MYYLANLKLAKNESKPHTEWEIEVMALNKWFALTMSMGKMQNKILSMQLHRVQRRIRENCQRIVSDAPVYLLKSLQYSLFSPPIPPVFRMWFFLSKFQRKLTEN